MDDRNPVDQITPVVVAAVLSAAQRQEPVDEFTQAIAAALKAAQERPGQPSYREIAERTGLGLSTIERTMNGRRDIKTSYLRAICRELGLSMSDVIEQAEASLSSN